MHSNSKLNRYITTFTITTTITMNIITTTKNIPTTTIKLTTTIIFAYNYNYNYYINDLPWILLLLKILYYKCVNETFDENGFVGSEKKMV